MFSFIKSFLPTSYFLPGWLTLDTNPLDGLLQGLVGACGISVMCSLLRVHLLLEESQNEKHNNDTSTETSNKTRPVSGLVGMVQFVFVTGILAVVGSRVASLVVLEFCLRGISGLVTAGPDHKAQTHHREMKLRSHYLQQTFVCLQISPLQSRSALNAKTRQQRWDSCDT